MTMESVELYRSMERLAVQNLAAGETSQKVRRNADDMEREGFSVSADYQRVIASIMERINGRD